MNSVNLIGRLTRETEVKYTKDKTAYASNSIAVDNGKDNTAFIPIVAFNGTAEFLDKYCGEKGTRIGVTGYLKNDNYEDKDGIMRYQLVLVVNKIYFADAPLERNEKEYDTRGNQRDNSRNRRRAYR